MTALLIALAAALVGVLVVALVGQRRLAQGKSGRGAGDDELHRAQVELRRAKQLLQLSALTETLDLDDLLGRVLQGATQLAGADAAAVALWSKGEAPIVKALSLPADEALPLLGSWPPESRSRPSPSGTASRTRTWSPRTRSSSACSCRSPGSRIARRDARHLLAAHGRRAERGGHVGARGARDRRREGDRERAPVPGAARARRSVIPSPACHNRRYFHETLAHEVKRAHRYDRRLALIFFDLDDFKAINDEIGHLGGDAVLAEVAQRLRLVVRGADIPCRVGGDEFAVILPESSLEDAERFFRRLQLAINSQPSGGSRTSRSRRAWPSSAAMTTRPRSSAASTRRSTAPSAPARGESWRRRILTSRAKRRSPRPALSGGRRDRRRARRRCRCRRGRRPAGRAAVIMVLVAPAVARPVVRVAGHPPDPGGGCTGGGWTARAAAILRRLRRLRRRVLVLRRLRRRIGRGEDARPRVLGAACGCRNGGGGRRGRGRLRRCGRRGGLLWTGLRLPGLGGGRGAGRWRLLLAGGRRVLPASTPASAVTGIVREMSCAELSVLEDRVLDPPATCATCAVATTA